MNTNSFTLIEILVVATIMILLVTAGAVSYTSLNRSSRDGKRKADLEQIRAALEMYRSDNGRYPVAGNAVGEIHVNSCDAGTLFQNPAGTTTYLTAVPRDPQCSATKKYYYNAPGPTYSDYTLAAALENVDTVCQNLNGGQCGGSNCTSCVGPYGAKQ